MDEKAVVRTVKLVAESLAVGLVVCVSALHFIFTLVVGHMLLCFYSKEKQQPFLKYLYMLFDYFYFSFFFLFSETNLWT